MSTLAFDVLWRDRGATAGMEKLGNTTEKTGKRFHAAKIAGVAALAAIGVATVKFGKDSVSAYVDAQKSQIRLQEAFRKFPKLADSNISAFQRLNSQLALKTKFDDDATASGQAVLAQFKLTGQQITQMTPLLQDYAAKTGKDLPTAARDLGKAMLGQGRSLKAVGIDFKDTGSAGGNFKQIMGGLRDQVGGFAEKEGKSAAGQAAILKNQFGELQESAGQQLLPALLAVGRGLLKVVGFIQDNSAVFGSFKKIIVGTFSAFAESVGLGRLSFKSFSDFVATHQKDIVSGFVSGAKAALGLGKGLATGASIGLRALATLADSQGTLFTAMIKGFSTITHAAALSFGWIPGIGEKLKIADAGMAKWAAAADKSTRKVGAGLRGAADSIDRKVVPAIDKAQRSLDKIGKTEIAKAALRDSAAKAALAIKNVGTTSDGAQIKLKHFSDMSKLGAVQQKALKGRLVDAKDALRNQIRAMQDAHVGQDKLTAAWKKGKDRLYDEFRQMGMSREEARKLAKQYAGIPPKVKTTVSQPGMSKSRSDAHDLKKKYDDIPNKINTTAKLTFKNNAGKVVVDLNKSFQLVKGGPRLTVATGGVLPGYTPGKDVHHFHSATAGSLSLSGGEAIMRPEWTRKVGGPKAVARMNADAKAGFAGGGVFGRYEGAFINANSREGTSGSQMYGWAVKKKLEGAMAYAKKHGGGAGGLGDPAHVSNPRGVTSYHGGRFTRLFVANLKAAERSVGKHYSVYQGGFRPTTSYSGSTHNMDAIDARVNYSLLRAFRKHVGAMGDRTGLGHWASHMHGVPAPGHGYGSPSARAQYRDYLRRGGAKQGMKSPWGLEHGGVATESGLYQIAERRPERVLSARQTESYERIGRALEGTGGAVTVNITVDAPNFVGSSQDLVRALTKAEQSGQLDALKRRFK